LLAARAKDKMRPREAPAQRFREGSPMKRRMAAIMVGDIVGFSAIMEKSEERTIARLAACEVLIAEKVAALDGRIFNRAGDATLAEFPSPINACDAP
jgi:class 3 adenylate cyclase